MNPETNSINSPLQPEENFKKKFRKETQNLPERKSNLRSLHKIDERLNLVSLGKKVKSRAFEQTQVEPEAFQSLARLVIELEDKMPQYDTILSDEASARMISLLLKDLIDKKRKQTNKEASRLFFIIGGRDDDPVKNKNVEDFIEKNKRSFGKTLLSTKYIETGESITNLANLLAKHEVDFDISSVSIARNANKYPDEVKKRLYYGEENTRGLSFYNSPGLGVTKSGENLSAHPHRDPDAEQEDINEARKDIKILSQELQKLFEPVSKDN